MNWQTKLAKHQEGLEKEKARLIKEILEYFKYNSPKDLESDEGDAILGIEVWPNKFKLTTQYHSMYNDETYSDNISFELRGTLLPDLSWYGASQIFSSVKSVNVNLQDETVEFVF